MFTDTQLKAREFKLDIIAIVDGVNPKYKTVACRVAEKAGHIVKDVDMEGHANESQLTTLEMLMEKVVRLRSYR